MTTSSQAYGSYDGPDEDAVMVRTPHGFGFIPRRARVLRKPVRDNLARLSRVSDEIEVLEREREELLPALRDEGVSWSLLAWGMNMTEKGVKYRLGARP